MGLIKAAVDAVGGAVGDQFLEYVKLPDGLGDDVIVARGLVQHGSGNPNAQEGIISNGSRIVVPAGWTMMIVDNGKVTELSSESGEYTYDTSSEPSVFAGGLFKGIGDTIKTIGSRIAFGGQTAKDQRVYYVKTLDLVGNPFGSQKPELIADPMYGSVKITYNGLYTVKIDDPVALIANILGSNPKDVLTFNDVFSGDQAGENIIKGAVAENISTAIAQVMLENNYSVNMIQAYKPQVRAKLDELVGGELHTKYGLSVSDLSALRINIDDADLEKISQMDTQIKTTERMGQTYSNNMAGTMAAAAGTAMMNAASNENGAMMGFMGMNMAMNQANNLMGTAVGAQNVQNANQQMAAEQAPAAPVEAAPAETAEAAGETTPPTE